MSRRGRLLLVAMLFVALAVVFYLFVVKPAGGAPAAAVGGGTIRPKPKPIELDGNGQAVPPASPPASGTGGGGGGRPGGGGSASLARRKIGDFTFPTELEVSAEHPSLVKPIPAQFAANGEKVIRDCLQPLRNKWARPLYVTSGYRDAALNKAVRGAVGSQHLTASAADCTTRSRTANVTLFIQAVSGAVPGLKCGQMIYYPEKDFIHVGLPSASHPRPTFQIHDPARGLSYQTVSTSADATRYLQAGFAGRAPVAGPAYKDA